MLHVRRSFKKTNELVYIIYIWIHIYQEINKIHTSKGTTKYEHMDRQDVSTRVQFFWLGFI